MSVSDPGPTPGWRKTLAWFERLEIPFKAFGNLSVVALLLSFLGWVVSSGIQYNTWRGEHDLKGYQEDLAQATRTFTDLSGTMAKALNLQQQVVFNYAEAVQTAPGDTTRVEFLWNQARNVLDDYRKARSELRQSIGVIVRRAEIYLDWPSAENKDTLRARALLDPVTIARVEADIDCDKLIAQGNDIAKWGHPPVGGKPGAVSVDWNSSKHHLIVLYACFNEDHGSTEAIRRWAAASKTGENAPPFLPPDAVARGKLIASLKKRLDLQVERLDKFMVLAMNQIERFRANNAPPGYLCRMTGFVCERPAS